ncbi:MAG: hypothetical protein WC602_04595 [archaeon]
MPVPKRRKFLIAQKRKKAAKRREVVHAVSFNHAASDSFLSLKSILKNGFVGTDFPNATMKEKKFPAHWVRTWTAPSGLPETRGDMYSIEMLAKAKLMPEDTGHMLAGVKRAYPGQIKKIYVYVDGSISSAEKAKRKAFYLKEFGSVAVEFVE